MGKTWLVRDFAISKGLELIEFNFERNPDLGEIFKERSTEEILTTLERIRGSRIDKQGSLLFLDEIQKAPHVLANLRWFYEEAPELPVITTGSLLDFVLKDHDFSMPVGRISYLFMEPMSFKEFLDACGENILVKFLEDFELGTALEKPVHEKILDLFSDYIAVGGMPAAVDEWSRSRSPVEVAEIHQNLINTFIDDFNKYSGKIPSERLYKVLVSVPRLLGKNFMYSKVDRSVTPASLGRALDLLCSARICHRVIQSAGRGVPLAAQENHKRFKVIFLDTGLVSSLQGLVLKTKKEIRELARVNKGGISEQVVGQLLRTIPLKFIDPGLNYYVRTKKGSQAEIDYLIQHHARVFPVEVKSGATGSLKSLHQFMAERNLDTAIRIYSDKPLKTMVDLKTTTGEKAKYLLISIPFYLTGEIERFL